MAAIPKKELMARLEKSRRESGLKKCSFWLDKDQEKKVKDFVSKLNTSLPNKDCK